MTTQLLDKAFSQTKGKLPYFKTFLCALSLLLAYGGVNAQNIPDWNEVFSLNDGTGFTTIHRHRTNSSTIYAAAENGRIYRKTTSSSSWNLIGTLPDGSNVIELKSVSSTFNAPSGTVTVFLYITTDTGKIYEVIDDSGTLTDWVVIYSTSENIETSYFHYRGSGVIAVGNKIIKSDYLYNSGTSSYELKFDTVLSNLASPATSIVIKTNKAYVTSGKYILRSDESRTVWDTLLVSSENLTDIDDYDLGNYMKVCGENGKVIILKDFQIISETTLGSQDYSQITGTGSISTWLASLNKTYLSLDNQTWNELFAFDKDGILVNSLDITGLSALTWYDGTYMCTSGGEIYFAQIPCFKPSIYQQPVGFNSFIGGANVPSLRTIASGESQVGYFWEESSDGTNFSSNLEYATSTGQHLIFNTFENPVTLYYRCIAYSGDTVCTDTSNIVQVNIEAEPSGIPSIFYLRPSCFSSSSYFSFNIAGKLNGKPYYGNGTDSVYWNNNSNQWVAVLRGRDNGVLAFNNEDSYLPPTSTWSSDGGITHLNGCGDHTSAAYFNANIACTDFAEITKQPTAAQSPVGGNVVFSVEATGADLSYRWERYDGGRYNSYIPGASSTNQSTLTLSDIGNTAIIGMYRVIVSSESCPTPSNDVELSIGEPEPLRTIFTSTVTGDANAQVVIPVGVNGFIDYQTLQGNITLPSATVTRIDSVVATSALSAAGIDGAIHINGLGFNYSYDKVDGNMSFDDGTILFNVYAKLTNTNDANLCAATSSDASGTSNQWSKYVDENTAETITPEFSFGDICAQGDEAVEQTLAIGNIGTVCPTGTFTVPFEYSGYYNNPTFILMVNDDQAGTVTAGTFEFEVDASILDNGDNFIQIKETSVGELATEVATVTISQYAELTATNYVSGAEYCPGSAQGLSFESDQPVTWTYFFDGGDAVNGTGNIEFISPGAGDLLIFAYSQNEQGCINPTPQSYTISFADSEAPALALSQSTFDYFGETEATFSLEILETATFSDNCTDEKDLVFALYDGTNEQTAITFTENGTFDVRVRDEAGNQTAVTVTVNLHDAPTANLSQTEYFSSHYGKSADDLNLTVTAELNGPLAFDSISGTIDFGVFVDEQYITDITTTIDESMAVLTTNVSGSEVTFKLKFVSPTNDNTYKTAVQTALANGLFTLALQPNLEALGKDSTVTPALTASFFDIFDAELATTVSFDSENSNTLEGLSKVFVSFDDEDKNAFTKDASVACVGCINNSLLDSTALISDAASAFDFYALANATISMVYTDLSGDEIMLSTADAIANRQYIIQQRSFDMSQQVKGDLDYSGDINTLDVLAQRKSVVGSQMLFQNAYGQASIYNPLTWINDNYTTVTDSTLATESVEFYFTVFSIGKTADVVKPKSNQEVVLQMLSSNVNDGAQIRIPVLANQFSGVAGYQFTIEWDSELLSLEALESGAHNLFTGETRIEDGQLMVTWMSDKAKDINVAEGTKLFELVFDVNQVKYKQGQVTEVKINSTVTEAMAYSADLRAYDLVSNVARITLSATNLNDLGNGYAIGNAYPNPFTATTSVEIALPADQEVTFTLMNNLGQLVSETRTLAKGTTIYTLPNTESLSAGVYTLLINGQGIKQAVKVVKQ